MVTDILIIVYLSAVSESMFIQHWINASKIIEFFRYFMYNYTTTYDWRMNMDKVVSKIVVGVRASSFMPSIDIESGNESHQVYIMSGWYSIQCYYLVMFIRKSTI